MVSSVQGRTGPTSGAPASAGFDATMRVASLPIGPITPTPPIDLQRVRRTVKQGACWVQRKVPGAAETTDAIGGGLVVGGTAGAVLNGASAMKAVTPPGAFLHVGAGVSALGAAMLGETLRQAPRSCGVTPWKPR